MEEGGGGKVGETVMPDFFEADPIVLKCKNTVREPDCVLVGSSSGWRSEWFQRTRIPCGCLIVFGRVCASQRELSGLGAIGVYASID